MTPNSARLHTVVICSTDSFPQVEIALGNQILQPLVHVSPSDESVLSPDVKAVVIGPGIDRAYQIEMLFSREVNGPDVYLFAPEFKSLSKALGTKQYGTTERIVSIKRIRTGTFTLVTQRIIDLLIAVVATVLILVPAILILGPAILLTSRGGIFFSTTVVGENGRRFTWRKFRSMRTARLGDDQARRAIVANAIRNGETDSSNSSTKVVDETRITAVGRIIRKTSIDELPQLLNVIAGSMSLVGPRPCLPYEYEEYNEWQRRRLEFKPGITGVWQVYGRSRVNFDEMVFMDVCGRLNRSILSDLKLLILTVPVALLGKGAE